MQKIDVGFIGAGNMARAIFRGILSAGILPSDSIHVFDVNPGQYEAFSEPGVIFEKSSDDLVAKCDVVILAVKPQNFQDVLSGIRSVVSNQKLFVSIAAGISSNYIIDTLGCACPIVRVMPNTPLLIGKGATALCRTAQVSEEQFNLVKSFFASCGSVEELPESQMNAIIAVNGSSPAYIYLFAKAVVDEAACQGIDREVALRLFCKTLEGSAGMLLDSGKTAEELIKMVSSPGGTTLKALEVLYQENFEQLVGNAMKACTKRAEELGK